MMKLTAVAMSDEELAAIGHALSNIEDRTSMGDALFTNVTSERARRQQQQAQEEGWHYVSTSPDWIG